MDRAAANKLATELHERLGKHVLRVRPEQINVYSGGVDTGWAARVIREDGTAVDVIGSGAAGYNITDRTLGWVDMDRLIVELLQGAPGAELDEVSPPTDADLIDRLTQLSVKLTDVAGEVRAVRDELTLRTKRQQS